MSDKLFDVSQDLFVLLMRRFAVGVSQSELLVSIWVGLASGNREGAGQRL